MKRSAFTLIELLVVIAIIGILSAIAVIAYGSAKAQARNAQRIGNVKQIMTAFGVGYNLTNSYPYDTTDAWYCLSAACTGLWNSYGPDGTVNTFFNFSAKPVDPTDGVRNRGGFVYNGDWTTGSGSPADGAYLAYALEKTSNNQCPLGFMWDDKGTYFQCMVRLNQQ
jgi:prepilin-type N-terminal cleavage/methylation domain-containing protein